MRLINADTVVTIQTYDDMYEEWKVETMTVAEAMDKWSDEGCPPTIDAEPVRHGTWEWKNGKPFCSVCKKQNEPKHHFEDGTVEEYDYCSNCGAKMDGKENE